MLRKQVSGRNIDHSAVYFDRIAAGSRFARFSKRQRGRRGLDMLQRLRNNSKLDIQIVETDFPAVKEVDLKLIELGKQLEAVIVTNDFNLNKVSQLRGVKRSKYQ